MHKLTAEEVAHLKTIAVKTATKNVTSSKDPATGNKLPKPVTVAVATFPVYETLSQAVAHEGEEAVLGLFNTQNATNIMNGLRTSFTQPINREKIKQELVNGELFEHPEFKEVISDRVRREALIERLVDEKIAARQKAIVAQVKEQTEEEDKQDDSAE